MADLKLLIRFRPIEKADEPLLLEIYSGTREDELAQVPEWPEKSKSAFLHHQFTAQHTFYQQHYPKAEYQIILINGESAGRLYVDRRPDDIHIIDITILPPFRNSGYGAFILNTLMNEANSVHKTVSIYVEKSNRATQLYERLGFTVTDDSNSVYAFMKWNPLPRS